MFNVPDLVKSDIVLLEKMSKNDEALTYFMRTCAPTARLLAWAAKVLGHQ